MSDFTLEAANWASDAEQLKPLRLQVFVAEQGVPEDEEFDADDPRSQHFMARDAEGTVVGVARLTPDGRIGRMAVDAEWRGRGVGSALLQSAIDAAAARGLSEVRLSAQTHALEFYARHGFEASGEVFDDCGIPHRWMSRSLPQDFVAPVPRREHPVRASELESGVIRGLGELQHGVAELLRIARRQVDLFTGDLEGLVFDQQEAVEQLKRLLTLGNQPQVRVIVVDSRPAIDRGHRWIDLGQRRPSAMQIRNPHPDDADHVSGLFVVDRRHLIHRPLHSRPEGELWLNAPRRAAQHLRFFDEAWERASQDPNTRRLGL